MCVVALGTERSNAGVSRQVNTPFKLLVMAVVIVAVIVGVLAGHSQSPSAAARVVASSPTPIPAAGPLKINIVPSASTTTTAAFSPVLLTVHVGQTVTWTNISQTNQSITADDGRFTSNVLTEGSRYRHRFKRSGTFGYGSYLDPTVHGVVQVLP